MAEASSPNAGDLVSKLRAYFDESRDATQIARTESGIDRDYYDGHQLTAAERAVLRARKQPPIINNRVKRSINGILGVIEQGKTDPRAYMRNPPDPSQQAPQGQQGPPQPGTPQGQAQSPKLDAGDVATMTLRYIADTTHFKATKMDAAETFFVEGVAAAVIEIDANKDVSVTQIRFEEFFYDPRSRRNDFSDARYMGVAKWMYADTVAAIYPEKKKQLSDFMASGDASGLGAYDMTWEDKPENVRPWVDSKQRRLMIAEMYYLESTNWSRCVFFAGGTLEEGPSPYQDDKGRTVCAIEAQSAYVDRENRRYGEVRDMRPMQDEVNMRRGKALHEINSRQIQADDISAQMVTDPETARAEAARPDGIIPAGWKIVPRQDIVANNLELLAEAKAELERMGPNPAILGRQGADASGRAVQFRQNAGMTELARPLGRYSEWELRCYKAMWARARQFWDAPKWIRVTDDEGTPDYVQINEPSGHQASIDPQTGQPTMVPQFNNHIAKMDVDIIVDTVPDTATLEQEIFQDLLGVAKVFGPQAVPFAVLLKFAPIAKKKEIIDFLEQEVAKQQQQAMPAIALKASKEAADIQAQQARTGLTVAQAGLAEAQTVVAALEGHLQVTKAAQLPPGIVLDGSGKPTHVIPSELMPQPSGGAPNGANTGATGP